jgi:hypothetical protein
VVPHRHALLARPGPDHDRDNRAAGGGATERLRQGLFRPGTMPFFAASAEVQVTRRQKYGLFFSAFMSPNKGRGNNHSGIRYSLLGV